jgi:ArsR family transcriptional regulator
MKTLSDEQMRMVAVRGSALADPTRVRIIDVLARAPLPVGRVAASLRSEPSTISKHLQVLFRAGLVERRRSGSAVIYSLADTQLIACCRYLGATRGSSRRRTD